MSRTLHEPDAVRACRRLLRHLDDARGAEATDVRLILRALAAGLGNRSRAILLRCDLGGEPHKQVAQALGLSMRQFYRERAAMIARLAMLLNERDGTARNAAVDLGRLALARANVMQFSGQRSQAVELFGSIAASAVDDDVRVTAQCAALEICIEEGAFSDARARLGSLENLDEPTALTRARIDHERRTYLWCTGRETEALELGDRSLDAVMLLARSDGNAAREFATSALAALARQAFMCGRFEQARKRLELAQDAHALADHPPVWARINVLLLSDMIRTVTRPAHSVPRDLAEASTLAMHHGLAELVVLTVIGLSVDDQMRRDPVTALSRLEQILPIAREACSNLNFAHVCLRLAELRIAAGDPLSALRLLQDARNALPAKNYTWTYNSLLAAHAYAAAHDFAKCPRRRRGHVGARPEPHRPECDK